MSTTKQDALHALIVPEVKAMIEEMEARMVAVEALAATLGAGGISGFTAAFPLALNGQLLNFKGLTELTTIAAAATSVTTIQIPAKSIVLAVSALVTTIIPTATTFDVGDGITAAKFNTAAVAVAAGSSDPGTKAGPVYFAAATAITLTMNGTPPAAATGRVRITIHYISVTVPTS